MKQYSLHTRQHFVMLYFWGFRRFETLMGLFHEMDLAVDDMHGWFKIQIGDGAIFVKCFGCFNDFITQKVYFSRLLRVYFRLIMLAACTLFSTKIKINQALRLFRPRSIYLCHQKPNPARETVDLTVTSRLSKPHICKTDKYCTVL
jgi:hypothetical protein